MPLSHLQKNTSTARSCPRELRSKCLILISNRGVLLHTVMESFTCFFRLQLDCQIFTEGNLLSGHYETQDWCRAAVAVDLLKVSPFCNHHHPGPLGSWSHLLLRSFYSVWSDSQLWEEYWLFQISSIPEWWRPLCSRETGVTVQQMLLLSRSTGSSLSSGGRSFDPLAVKLFLECVSINHLQSAEWTPVEV